MRRPRGSVPGEHERDLPGHVRFDARGREDPAATRHGRQLARQQRRRADPAIGKRLQLHAQLDPLARRQVREVAHRAIELHGDVGLVVVVAHLDHVHESSADLSDGSAGSGEPGECQEARRTPSTGYGAERARAH